MDYTKFDLFLAACVVLLLLQCVRITLTRRYPPPPGPKPFPIIGNMLDMSREKPWETYQKLGMQYGDIVHIKSLGTSFVILNTFRVAWELLEKRSSIYSGRPELPILELIGLTKGTAFRQYGAVWRRHRALYHRQMNKGAAREFIPRQLDAARTLLRSILETPEKYKQHFRHMSAGIAMNVAYGYDILSKDDPFVDLAERTTRVFSHATQPGAYLVNLVPSLKHVPEWIPGAKFQTFIRESQKIFSDARNIPFEDVKRRMREGIARPSFVANSLKLESDETHSEEDIIKHVAGSVYGAGSDTTVSSMTSFLLAMVLYPAVQKKAQAELDSVIGHGRLPEFHDRFELPYVEAVFKEVLRWFPVLFTGLPHCAMVDDVYDGYHIPKGATIIYNTWGIMHDPEMYPDPFTFRPERFLPDENGKVAKDPAVTGAFGFGRRICPGRHLAGASVWITVASMLAVFDISPALDEYGHEIDVHYASNPPPGALNHPRPFPCCIKPRSSNTENLIRQGV